MSMDKKTKQSINERRTDWKGIYRRLGEVSRSLAAEVVLTEGEKRQILKRRAAKLAEKPSPDQTESFLTLTGFSLGDEHYGVESRFVDEVLPLGKYTRLPGCPDYIFGIINLRGTIVSVVDLRPLLGLPGSSPARKKNIVVLHHEKMRFGVLTDLILGIEEVPRSQVQAVAAASGTKQNEYVLGATPERQIVLDAHRILADETLVIDQLKRE